MKVYIQYDSGSKGMRVEIVKEDDSCVYLKVGAGENRHETLMRSLQHGYVG
jgi:hypothetical protein